MRSDSSNDCVKIMRDVNLREDIKYQVKVGCNPARNTPSITFDLDLLIRRADLGAFKVW